MSTLTKTTHSIIQVLMNVYGVLASLVRQYFANGRKMRSLRQLERLDDYLLDDIGLVRENHQIVPIRVAPIARKQLYSAQESQLRTRARTHRRERHRHSRRRAT